jgi:hypothetical protein
VLLVCREKVVDFLGTPTYSIVVARFAHILHQSFTREWDTPASLYTISGKTG